MSFSPYREPGWGPTSDLQLPSQPRECAEVGTYWHPYVFHPRLVPRSPPAGLLQDEKAGPPPAGACSTEVQDPSTTDLASSTTGARGSSGAVPQSLAPGATLRACSTLSPPTLHQAASRLLIHTHFLMPNCPYSTHLYLQVVRAPCSFHAMLGFQESQRQPDTLNHHHPFITPSIAALAKPCWAPRRQLKSPCTAVGWREQSRFAGPCLRAT